MEARPRDGVEILWHNRACPEWQRVENPRAVQISVDASGHLLCSLECDGVGAGPHDAAGEFPAEVIVQKHFVGSTEVRYAPKALLYYRPRDGRLEIRSTGNEPPKLDLPPQMRNWENPHTSFWSYTARPTELAGLLELLQQVGSPTDPH